MSSDESGGAGRKPRPVTPPRLPPGPLREFKRCLYRLYLSAGTPSLDRIAEAAVLDDSLPGAPSRDTVGRLLTGAKLPGLHDAESVAAVLARLMDRDPAETVVRIRELWIEAKEHPGPPPRTAEAWGAARLGVHHAVDVDGAGFDRLTPYIERTHDETVRGRLRGARGGEAVLAVLVGQSSTGKTRSAFEAVRIELPDWPVLFPSGPRELLDWIEGDAVDAGSVIWLNETQRYLTGPAGEDVAESLAGLLGRTAPLAVLGSMWPEYARRIGAQGGDDHFHARALLRAHHAEILVPDRLGGSLGRARKAAAHDPRLRAALAAAGEPARVIQQLTGGPELVRRYEMGPGNAFSEIEHAIVTAAVDARRLGHAAALSPELLAAAVVGYLPSTARVTGDSEWFAAAVQALSSADSGRLPALVPDRVAPGVGAADGYHPADYLDQSVRRARAHLAPPAELWEAAEAHGRTADDLYAMGGEASVRCRHGHALRLYRRALDRGADARPALALLWEEAGDRAAAESVAADSGWAWAVLAGVREGNDDGAGALRAHERAALEGEPSAWDFLARLREYVGDRAGAEEAAVAAAEQGHTRPWLALARRRERAGDEAGALAAYTRAVAAGDPWGWMGRARLYDNRTGRDAEAETAYLEAADAGVLTAWSSLVHLRWRAGDQKGAEAAATRAAELGNAEGWSALLRYHRQRGETAAAEHACRLAATAGSTGALADLALLREESGDTEGAEEAAARAARFGHAEAWWTLARVREEAGRSASADLAAARAARAGDTEAWTALARIRERTGDTEGAEHAADEAAEHGSADTWATLARIRERAGDREGSLRAARAAVAAGGAGVWSALGQVREDRGDGQGAEVAYRAATDAGDTAAWTALGRLHEEAGDRRRAERCYRTGVDAGDYEAWEGLLRVTGGDPPPPLHGRFGLDAAGGFAESL
ncbi:hypothetical protein ABZ471_26895 [Streptomyces sp. NPDC005728]|uniref:hypothetical protein n=1 Tax=Streptomyces sp. NPDC005728 TaxID=3157054 RepID=UPI0033C35931